MGTPQKELKDGAEIMVLAVLEGRPRHGYDIACRIDGRNLDRRSE